MKYLILAPIMLLISCSKFLDSKCDVFWIGDLGPQQVDHNVSCEVARDRIKESGCGYSKVVEGGSFHCISPVFLKEVSNAE